MSTLCRTFNGGIDLTVCFKDQRQSLCFFNTHDQRGPITEENISRVTEQTKSKRNGEV